MNFFQFKDYQSQLFIFSILKTNILNTQILKFKKINDYDLEKEMLTKLIYKNSVNNSLKET